jgi:hypothetical protein
MFSQYCPSYPWISRLTSGGRSFMIQVLSVSQQKHPYWIIGWDTIRNLRPCVRKKLFLLQTVHLPVFQLSTGTRPGWWMWIRARFCPVSQVSASEAELGQLGPLGGFFGPVRDVWFWFWRIEASI